MANLRMEFKNGTVTRGEPIFNTAIPRRGAGRFIVPEWGTVRVDEKLGFGYDHSPNYTVGISAQQDTTAQTNYVEILYRLPDGNWSQFDEMLAAGRAGTSTFTLFLDLVHGERIVGPILTEEVGEVFGDWHWNRLLGGRSVSIESQAAMRHVDGNNFRDTVAEAFKRHTAMTEEGRNRLRVAAQWYWRADREPDRVVRFISYWLCVEALELGENANIAPVKRKVAALVGIGEKDLGDSIGRLYGIRSGLLHGSSRDVTNDLVKNVRALALALLEDHSLGAATSARLEDLRTALGLDG
ncbi:MAG: hypothetical protein JWN09_1277 [Microbacteriaceae bacterium]|nr:hypothetical protein [Microbacteriaceae bacterium]